MWLFSFMHSCNIFLQTNSVQTLGPIHKSSFAINTGLWWAFLIQISDRFLSEDTLWPVLLSPARAPARFPHPPLPLPTSPNSKREQKSMGRGAAEAGGEEAQAHAPTPRTRRLAREKGEAADGDDPEPRSGPCEVLLRYTLLDYKRDSVCTRKTR